jgi:nucleotide-binding universal stress UspA family protein
VFQKILVPLDGSPLSELALPYAAALAGAHGGELLLVRVIPPRVHAPPRYSVADAEAWLIRHARDKEEAEQSLEGLVRSPLLAPHRCHWLLCEASDVATQLVETVHQRDMDTVVIATRGRTGLARWVLGSVAQQILERSPAPVLVVRDEATRAQE